MADSTLATYSRDGHIATITYNRPEKLNAINAPMRAALNEAWNEFLADEAAWVGIVNGAGKAFCVGADLTAVSACDFVIAADDAIFGMPEVRIGTPTIVGAIRIPRRIPNFQHARRCKREGGRAFVDRRDPQWLGR